MPLFLRWVCRVIDCKRADWSVLAGEHLRLFIAFWLPACVVSRLRAYILVWLWDSTFEGVFGLGAFVCLDQLGRLGLGLLPARSLYKQALKSAFG
jgi:hypothetical protein